MDFLKTQEDIQRLAASILESDTFRADSNLLISIDLPSIARYLGVSTQGLDFCVTHLLQAILDRRRKFGGLTLFGAFSFDFSDNGYFDVKTSPCFNGLMADLMKHKFAQNRSHGPIYSFYCFGGDDVQLESSLMTATPSSFGQRSVFEKLIQERFKLVNVGHHYASSFTIAHHFEQLVGVDYRYLKRFDGIIRCYDGSEFPYETEMYVREPETVFSGLTLSGSALLVEKSAVHKRYLKGRMGGLLVYTVDLHRVGQLFDNKSHVKKYIRPILVNSNLEASDRPITLLESRGLYARDLRARR